MQSESGTIAMDSGYKSRSMQTRTHTIRVRGFSLWLPAVILALFSGCGANIFSTNQEIAMGTEFAEQLDHELTFLDSNDWNEYINALGQRIVSVCDRPGLGYRFKIVDDSTTINAFALPGGYIYVYSGLLMKADNEAEVVGVLAHEVGHVVGKHGVKKLTSLYGYQFIVSIALGSNPGVLEKITADILGGLGMLNYGRKNENEADTYGIKYLYALGYDPRGFITFFEKLADLQSHNPSFTEKLMSTHPPPQDRIARAREQIKLLPPKTGLVLNREGYQFRKATLYR